MRIVSAAAGVLGLLLIARTAASQDREAGLIYAVTGDYDRAVASLEEALHARPYDRDIWEWLVVTTFARDGWDSARSLWLRRHGDEWSSQQAQYSLADLLYRGASALATSAEQQAMSYAEFNHRRLAFEALAIAASSRLGSSNFFSLGFRQIWTEEWSSKPAVELLNRMIWLYERLPLKPALPPAALRYAKQAEEALADHRWKEAERNYDQALRVAPWWAEAHYNLALMLGTDGQLEMAIWEISLSLDLSSSGPYVAIARNKLAKWRKQVNQ
jgi:tetratricopeptide (TPR) repeat protein